MLGFTPILGRNFAPSEGWNQRVLILGYGAWERYYGKDPNVVGKKMLLDDIPYTVIGVLPSSFWFPDPGEVLAPWADADLAARSPKDHNFGVFGHLKRGVSVQQANAELNLIEHRISEQFVALTNWATTVSLLKDVVSENVRSGFLLLLAAVALVLLIACANLANLMLARAAGRTRETAIRMALGAGRWRLARQFLTESAVLGAMGGILGLLLALWGVDLLNQVVPGSMPLSGGAGIVVRPAIHADQLGADLHTRDFARHEFDFRTGARVRSVQSQGERRVKGGRPLGIGGWEQVTQCICGIGSSAGACAVDWSGAGDEKFLADPTGASRIRRRSRTGAGDGTANGFEVPDAAGTGGFFPPCAGECTIAPDGAVVRSYQSTPTRYQRRASKRSFRSRAVHLCHPTKDIWLTTEMQARTIFAAMGIPLRKGRVFADQDRADRPLSGDHQ